MASFLWPLKVMFVFSPVMILLGAVALLYWFYTMAFKPVVFEPIELDLGGKPLKLVVVRLAR